jgi:hypothetical protein
MPLRRTALALAIASLTLPAAATARPPALPDSSGAGSTQALSDQYGWGQEHFIPKPYDRYYGIDRRVQPNPDQRTVAPTSSLAGSTSPQDLRNPDGTDAARAGEIAKAMEHYQRSQPLPAAARPASPPQGGYRQVASHDDTPGWPEIAFAGVVLLATAGGVVRVRMRRSQRVAA